MIHIKMADDSNGVMTLFIPLPSTYVIFISGLSTAFFWRGKRMADIRHWLASGLPFNDYSPAKRFQKKRCGWWALRERRPCYLLCLSFVQALILLIDSAEVWDDDRNRKCNYENATERTYSTDDFACNCLRYHISVSTALQITVYEYSYMKIYT